ncbi:phosphomannomutase/phosphoglucomutase [Stutzerimonas decontaminans]|uniref:phosphomannomutase n=2 Tax=Stutzerimonas TaxID=2901164 RepID=A0ABX4VTG5_9GAMM|nr:phosphomannomutase/phosphoglucomutase [Stutzerimonas decontaminans]AHY44492.1 phosphomannomutase [Stutzerimonas decontaminans]PNF83474.1 phosphomannomutase/phosphoglucomutase [Stutzerimonas decontaminans]
MALFKRTAKDSGVLNPTDTRSKRGGFPLKPLLGGLAASLIGLGAAAALLWVGLQNAQQQQQTQLAQAWGQSQASTLQQALRQLRADTETTVSRQQLVDVLRGDAERRRAVEERLLELPGVVDTHLNIRGRAAPDTSRPGPLNFAALDLLQRAEAGQSPAPEAYKVGDRWLLYSAVPLRAEGQQAIRGTLLLVTDLERLFAGLPTLPAGAGQLRLSQQFAGAPEQVLLQRGVPADGAAAQTLASGNANWKLVYIPGSEAGQATLAPIFLIGAALLALAGMLIGLQLVLGGQQRRLREDVMQISRLLQELSTGRTIQVPALSLPVLDALARNMVRLPVRAAGPAPTQAPAAAPAVRPAKPTEYVDPRLPDTDILDIDILDEDQDIFGLDTKERETAMSSAKAPNLPASIFRAYDIRGVVGDSLTTETAYWVGRAIGSESLAKGEPNVSVGRDGRLSGPELVQHLIQGLLDSGCDVSDIGMVPTPVLYYAANILAGKSGVMLTGSHNPPDYNGFKIVIAGDTLANEQIQTLRKRIETNDLSSGVGKVEQIDVLERYFQQIRSDIAMAKPMKVVVDCGNGVAGVIAPRMIEALGCTVIPLYCDVDGNFPNHHPDPGKPENLVDLIAKVKSENADLGLAFDGDGDRVGVVTNAGTMIYPDRLLMLFAKDVVSRNPGADIIFDVKCTRRLTPLISGYGGRPVMWKTGHSLIKKKMKESGALLAGEMSGHIFFKERWFGFDDGIYSAARLLEILSQDKRDAEQVFAAFPCDISTPEINITVTEESKFTIMDALQRDAQWGEANLITLDGVRVDYPKGWGLIRASNTTPVLVLRFEADSEEELSRIQGVFRGQLLNVAPDLKLPF